MSIGVTKDYKLKVKNLHASHTLGTTIQEEKTFFPFSFFLSLADYPRVIVYGKTKLQLFVFHNLTLRLSRKNAENQSHWDLVGAHRGTGSWNMLGR
jgi:hypothetical protein